MKRGQPPKRRLPTHCTDCACPLSEHDSGWCYGCHRTGQCNHRPRARSSRLAPVNRERKPREFERAYGSANRAAWVASLPCAACGIVGYSANAHVLGNGGAGRKGDADTIAPLCVSRPGVNGCHDLFDNRVKDGRATLLRRYPRFDPAACAERTEAAWRAVVSQRGAA